jgi:hypothetical protein
MSEGTFTPAQEQALRAAVAVGIGREPTDDEFFAVLKWAVDIYRDSVLVQGMLDGTLALDLTSGIWAFLPINAEVQA